MTSSSSCADSIPTISLRDLTPDFVYTQPEHPLVRAAASGLFSALELVGFAQISDFGHILPPSLVAALDGASRRFFTLSDTEKMGIAMMKGGRAWRGAFLVGEELTSGKVDFKEGIYFGTEMTADEARGRKFCGPSLFPRQVPEMKELVLTYMARCQVIGHLLMALVAVSLEFAPTYFRAGITRTPTELFRIFHYPTATVGNNSNEKSKQNVKGEEEEKEQESLGVGVHTDYGLLTILKQDDVGGLQVQDASGKRYIDVKPDPNTLVVNIGDMLEAVTSGLFRSTPHRVLRPKPLPDGTVPMRLSFPYFFDPGLESRVTPLPLTAPLAARAASRVAMLEKNGFSRWDSKGSAIISAGRGIRYGDYLEQKTAKVFPALSSATIKDTENNKNNSKL